MFQNLVNHSGTFFTPHKFSLYIYTKHFSPSKQLKFLPKISIFFFVSFSFPAGRSRTQALMANRVGDSFNGDWATTVNNLFSLPETMEKFMFPSRGHDNHENRGVSSIPVDILDTPKEYIFFMDIPRLSKAEIQVTVEDDNTLVIRSNGKRKRQDGEDEGCKYLRLERRVPQKLLRKFRLPENANVLAITAKCENGVLTVVVEKNPPPPKSKTVEVAIA